MRKRSAIWNFFSETDADHASCDICGNVYSRRGRSTTPLKTHLRSMHPVQFVEYCKLDEELVIKRASELASNSQSPDQTDNKNNPRKTEYSKVSAAQLDALCTFFEENPEVIKDKQSQKILNKWKQITPQLNSLGPAKSYNAWANYLAQIKMKLEKQKIEWLQGDEGAEPIISNIDDFSEVKLRMLHVLRSETTFSGYDTEDANDTDTDMKDETKEEVSAEDNKYGMVVFDLEDSKPEVRHHAHKAVIERPVKEIVLQDKLYEPEGDEFDTFGKNVAQQLRSMPLNAALETQEMLLSVLRKQRMKLLKEQNQNIDPFA